MQNPHRPSGSLALSLRARSTAIFRVSQATTRKELAMKDSQFRPQFELLEGRLAFATLTIAPPGFSDPVSGNIVQQIIPSATPGLTTAQAHTGGISLWSLADAADALAEVLASNAAAPFIASGSVTSVTFHGNHRLGPVDGSATQIGPFTGNLDARVTRLGAHETATGTLTLVSTKGD